MGVPPVALAAVTDSGEEKLPTLLSTIAVHRIGDVIEEDVVFLDHKLEEL